MSVHNLVETQLGNVRQGIRTGESVISAQSMQFLRAWLLTHIQTLDKTLCDYLAKCTGAAMRNNPGGD
jgi:hemerythrin